jgi:hypothetical protein
MANDADAWAAKEVVFEVHHSLFDIRYLVLHLAVEQIAHAE